MAMNKTSFNSTGTQIQLYKQSIAKPLAADGKKKERKKNQQQQPQKQHLHNNNFSNILCSRFYQSLNNFILMFIFRHREMKAM